MNRLVGSSIAAGRPSVGVAAGINCKIYLDYPSMQIVKLPTARSFVNCNVRLNMTKVNYSRRRRLPKIPEKNTSDDQFDDEGNRLLDSDDEGNRLLDPDDVIVRDNAINYLGTLNWESLQNHIVYFPRKRSNTEVRLIFDKWLAHYEKEYPSAELKEMRYATFKKRLAIIDQGNLKGEFTSVLKADSDIEG